MNAVSLETYMGTLAKDIKTTIENDVKEDAWLALREAINETVYLEKKTYRPTYNLLNAVEVFDFKVGNNKATFRVGINASKLVPEIRMPQEWNAHVGTKGQSFRDEEGLVSTLDKGTNSSKSLYKHVGHGFFDKAFKTMEGRLINKMATSLRAKGWKVDIM